MMLTILYLLVNTKTIMLALYRTYEFTSGMKVLYLTYWTLAQISVRFFLIPRIYLR